MENRCTQIIETDDGTGDAIIELPDELLEKIGWKVGDEIQIARDEAGDIRLTKLDI
jgi:uncharacterized membrane protein (UPF0127 family)